MVVALFLIEHCDFCHFFICQREIENIKIILDVRDVLAAGDNDKTHPRKAKKEAAVRGLRKRAVIQRYRSAAAAGQGNASESRLLRVENARFYFVGESAQKDIFTPIV